MRHRVCKLTIEYLVGNAFQHYLRRTGKHVLSLNKIEQYGIRLVENLTNIGIQWARTDINKYWNEILSIQYSDYFDVVDNSLVVLKQNISEMDLYNRFTETFPSDIKEILRDEKLAEILF